MATAIASAAIRGGRATPHGSAAVGAADDARNEIRAVLGSFLLPAFTQFGLCVSLADSKRQLHLSVRNQRWVAPFDQFAVWAAPVPLDVAQVQLMVVQNRADRFVGQLDTVFAAIASYVQMRVTVISEGDGAAMLAAILLDRYGLCRSFGIELALEFRPYHGHAEESAAVWGRRIDLLSDKVSGNGRDFGMSAGLGGVLAYSRILADVEVVAVANTNPVSPFTGHVVVDLDLNRVRNTMTIRLSNLGSAGAPQIDILSGTRFFNSDGSVAAVSETAAVKIDLQPSEVQVLVPQ